MYLILITINIDLFIIHIFNFIPSVILFFNCQAMPAIIDFYWLYDNFFPFILNNHFLSIIVDSIVITYLYR